MRVTRLIRLACDRSKGIRTAADRVGYGAREGCAWAAEVYVPIDIEEGRLKCKLQPLVDIEGAPQAYVLGIAAGPAQLVGVSA